ncbi:uncharacterized protein LOC115970506 [Quercus lobata]|uniref:uncharacterized protein LOC115970506 n=1 Tax=Quercus lobata TaxID=97700 RepID=UPI0012492F9D|nr:uncharacterized protein LOC115970506 [Quercus lobata]
MTAALNRFISRSANRYRPFFLLMNKWKGFEWTEECALAFQQLKEYLSYPPIMSSPDIDEVLFAYIVVAPHAVSLVLIQVDSGIKRPVYYVNKSLHEAEIRYLPLEKAILAIVHGFTYQKMMTKMFEPQLGKNIEVYINDIVVKSKVVSKHVGDVGNIFEILRKHKLCLNTSKCSFGVGLGKFLSYMVTHRGIEGFKWTEECALAFQQLKEYLSHPPIMSSPEIDEVLSSYIAVAPHAVSLVLIRVYSGIKRPVYYLPLRVVLRSTDYTRRIAKWGTVLGAFDIKYMPRTSVKGQVLADLVAEFAEPLLEEVAATQNMDEKLVDTISLQKPLLWKVYVDSAANQKGSRVGLILISPEKLTIEKSLRLGFSVTNNEAKYEALLEGMSMVQIMGGKVVKMFSDSRLVVGQVKGELEARDERMQGYLSQVRYLQSRFESFSLLHIPRSGNTHTDSLTTLGTSSARNLPRVILIEDLCKPMEVKGKTVHVHQVRVGPSWMDPIVLFLREDILPEDKSEADKVRRKTPRFWLSED